MLDQGGHLYGYIDPLEQAHERSRQVHHQHELPSPFAGPHPDPLSEPFPGLLGGPVQSCEMDGPVRAERDRGDGEQDPDGAQTGLLPAAEPPPRVGHAMREIADYVDAVPGCNKSTALVGTGRPANGMGCWRPLQRAIAAGLIIVDKANPWARRSEHLLFRNERARRLWNLRSELLRGNPTHDRAEEIVMEIEALRQQQARTWVE